MTALLLALTTLSLLLALALALVAVALAHHLVYRPRTVVLTASYGNGAVTVGRWRVWPIRFPWSR